MDQSGKLINFLFENDVIFKHLQIPVLFLIILSLFYLYSFVDRKNIYWILLGWTLNCFYLICEWLNDYFEHIQYGEDKIEIIKFLAFNFDLVGAYFILYGARQYLFVSKVPVIRLIPHTHLLSTFFIICSLMNISELTSFNFLQVENIGFFTQILKSIILFIAYILFSIFIWIYFQPIKFRVVVCLVISIYAFIQFLPISEFFGGLIIFNINTIGFGIGFLAKIILLIHLILFTIKKGWDVNNNEVIKKEFHKMFVKAMHELEVPVNAIAESSDVLLQEENLDYKMSGKVRNTIKIIQASNYHNQSLLTAYTSIYHNAIDSDFTDSNLGKYNLHNLKNEPISYYNATTIAQMAISMIKIVNGQTKWKILANYGKNCVLECKISDIYQILRNLLKNSVEAIDNELGKILVEVRREKIKKEYFIKFVIKDNGVGVPLENISWIFEEENSTKPETNLGRGYGLPIVKEIVETYDGEIEVQSDPRNFNDPQKFSTKFTIIIPI